MKERFEKLLSDWKSSLEYMESKTPLLHDAEFHRGRIETMRTCIMEFEKELKESEPSIHPPYLYKGKPYSIFSLSKIKIDQTWIPVIIYKCEYHNPELPYPVRFPGDFYRLFELNM